MKSQARAEAEAAVEAIREAVKAGRQELAKLQTAQKKQQKQHTASLERSAGEQARVCSEQAARIEVLEQAAAAQQQMGWAMEAVLLEREQRLARVGSESEAELGAGWQRLAETEEVLAGQAAELSAAGAGQQELVARAAGLQAELDQATELQAERKVKSSYGGSRGRARLACRACCELYHTCGPGRSQVERTGGAGVVGLERVL